jgi:hypothetical protein
VLRRLFRRREPPPFVPLFPSRPPAPPGAAAQPRDIGPAAPAKPPATPTIVLRGERHVLLSGFFGDQFTRVYPAISEYDCVFFSNNAVLKDEVESKGWTFVVLSGHELSSDLRISSQQSKYVKFLQFLADYPEFANVDKFTYFDHKFRVTSEHIR